MAKKKRERVVICKRVSTGLGAGALVVGAIKLAEWSFDLFVTHFMF